MKTAILHVGLPKTGTTSIQSALFAARENLLSQCGIFYPSVSENLNAVLCMSFFEDPRMHIEAALQGLDTLESAREWSDRLLRELESDLRSTEWQMAVLSAEGLSNFSAEDHERLAAWLRTFVDDIRVMFWTRNPVTYASSVSQQLVKGGMTFDDILASDSALPFFEGRCNNLIHVYGRSNVEIHVFEEAMQSVGGIVGGFCRAIGIPPDLSEVVLRSARAENQSMSHLAVLLLEALNRQRPLIIDGNRNPLRHLHEQDFLSRILGAPFELPATVKEEIRTRGRDDAIWLHDTLGREVYPDMLDDAPLPNPMGALPAETLDSLASVLGDLLIHQP